MEKYIEVIKHIVELVKTTEEAFQYVQEKVDHLDYESGKAMLVEIRHAIESIESSLEPINEEGSMDDLNASLAQMKSEIEKILLAEEEAFHTGDLFNAFHDFKGHFNTTLTKFLQS